VASARIVALDPLYRGVLRVGGRPLEAPQASYAVTWRTAVPGGQAAVTASGVGAWRTSAWGCVSASGGCSDQPLRVIPSLARLQATFVALAVGGGGSLVAPGAGPRRGCLPAALDRPERSCMGGVDSGNVPPPTCIVP
jgi:hypothetical protein